MSDVRVEGLDTFLATMQKAIEELQQLSDAHAKASAIIASAAAAAAPRRTGRLASSVRSAPSAKQGGVLVSAPYAGPIEWGWPSRNIDATHFAMNAARQTEPQWVKFYEADVQKALDDVKGK